MVFNSVAKAFLSLPKLFYRRSFTDEGADKILDYFCDTFLWLSPRAVDYWNTASQNHTTSHHASEDLFYKIRLFFSRTLKLIICSFCMNNQHFNFWSSNDIYHVNFLLICLPLLISTRSGLIPQSQAGYPFYLPFLSETIPAQQSAQWRHPVFPPPRWYVRQCHKSEWPAVPKGVREVCEHKR